MKGKIETEIVNYLKGSANPITVRQLAISIGRENSYSFVLRKCNELNGLGTISMVTKVEKINNKDMLVKAVSIKWYVHRVLTGNFMNMLCIK